MVESQTQIEEKTLKFWLEKDIYKKVKEKNRGETCCKGTTPGPSTVAAGSTKASISGEIR